MAPPAGQWSQLPNSGSGGAPMGQQPSVSQLMGHIGALSPQDLQQLLQLLQQPRG